MKLRNFVIIGYLISTLITTIAVIWAVNKMVIVQNSGYLIIMIALVASLFGALVSLLLMKNVFNSLNKLRAQTERIANGDFRRIDEINSPAEFKELATDFNQMAGTLESTFQSLKESEKEKDMIIAQLSHDIKTPITSIRATVEGMLDGVIPEEESTHYLKTIDRQTDRLNNLVEELNYVTLNTSDEVRHPSAQQDVFVDKLLIDTMSEFQLKLDREKRDVNIEVEPEDAQIKSDPDKLSRILYNLINNALKYSNAGTRLDIVAKTTNQKLVVTIRDQGMGIKEADLDKVFKRLYRVEGSRNMKTGGHGLGLYIAQELAHQLNGSIRVESQYGHGSEFILELNLEH